MKVVNLNIILKDLDKMLHRVVGEDIDFKTFTIEELARKVREVLDKN